MYIIKDEQGRYVAQAGAPCSYTRTLQYARKFRELSDAEKHKCGNESIVLLDDELNLDRHLGEYRVN